MSSLVPVENVNVQNTVEESSYFYAIPGSEIEWTYIPPVTDGSFTSNVWSHFYANLGLYTNEIANRYNTTTSQGGFLNTSLEGIYDAYNTSGIIVGLINNETYRQSLIGRDGAVSIPLTTTGSTTLSGMTGLTNYFTFYDTPNLLQRETAGGCSKTVADTRKFESLRQAVIDTGIGQGMGMGNSGSEYESGVTFMFNDFTSLTSGSTSGFSQSHMNTNPYANGKLAAKFQGEGYHKAAGMVDCIGGIICFWDQDVVNSFNFGIATGGTGTTRAVFSDTDAYCVIKDFDSSVAADVRVNATPDILKTTTNPSRKQAIANGDTNCEEVVKVTQVCLYDTLGQVTAIGTPTEIIEKTDNYVVMNLSVKLDGGIGPVWSTQVDPSVYPS